MTYPEYPGMPDTESVMLFRGTAYPLWHLTLDGTAYYVSTTDLRDRLFVDGETGKEYVDAYARATDAGIAYYVSHYESPDDVKRAIDARHAVAEGDKPDFRSRVRRLVEAIHSPGSATPWEVHGGRQVYKANANDLGDHVAEFEDGCDALHAVECVNLVRELVKMLEAEDGRT